MSPNGSLKIKLGCNRLRHMYEQILERDLGITTGSHSLAETLILVGQIMKKN